MKRTDILVSYTFYLAQQVFYGHIVFEDMPFPGSSKAVDSLTVGIAQKHTVAKNCVAIVNIIKLTSEDSNELYWPIDQN